jgi:hypothetical protein
MDGLEYINMAQKHLDELKKKINEDNLDDFFKEMQGVSEAMFNLWDWVNVKHNLPR